MATTTTSVNRIAGATLARSNSIHLRQGDTHALVFHGQPATRHGQPGKNAPPPVPGGPAGTVAVQRSESQVAQGAIHVHIVECSHGYRIPQDMEVAVGRDLRLSRLGALESPGKKAETNSEE
jgi:hypothetical protein